MRSVVSPGLGCRGNTTQRSEQRLAGSHRSHRRRRRVQPPAWGLRAPLLELSQQRCARWVTSLCQLRARSRRCVERPAGSRSRRPSGHRTRRPSLAGHVLPGQHGRRSVDDDAGVADARRRRAARRLQPLRPSPRSRPLARSRRRSSPPPGKAVARAGTAHASDRCLPLRLRPHAGPAITAVSDPSGVREEGCLPLPRLGHPWQDTGPTRLREEGECRNRGELRRDPLGPRGGRHPTRRRYPWDRPVRADAGPPPARRRARPLFARKKGDRARHRRLRRRSMSISRSSKGSITGRRSSVTATPTSSSTSSTQAGTGCSQSSAWRWGSPWSRSCTRRQGDGQRRPSAFPCL